MERIIVLSITAMAALLWAADPALACSTCYGDPNSPLTKGAESGVWFLLAVVMAMQGGFAYFFFSYLRKRAQHYPDGSQKPGLHLIKG